MPELTDSEKQQLQAITGFYGSEPPAGWLECNDSNGIFRGDIDAADGYFVGTVSTSRLDVLSKLNVAGEAVSSYLMVSPYSHNEFRITVPAHFGEHASFVDFFCPFTVSHPEKRVYDYWDDGVELTHNTVTIIELYRDGLFIGSSSTSINSFYLKYFPTQQRHTIYTYYPIGRACGIRFVESHPITKNTQYRFILRTTGLGTSKFTHFLSAGIRIR